MARMRSGDSGNAPRQMRRDGQARLAALDGLRGLAALGIVVLHVWMFDHGDSHGGFDPQSAADMAINELRLGVVLFFVLSGFLLYRPFLAAAHGERPFPALRSYARRRAARLLPAYWFALAGSFLLLAWLHHPLRAGTGELPVFLLFGQNYLAGTAKHLDPPMWSLGVEVSFYAALPLVGFLALRAGPRRAAQLALCGGPALAGLAYTALAVLLEWPWTATATLPIHMTEFAAGMAVAVVLQRRSLSRSAGVVLIALGAVLVAGDAAWHALGSGGGMPQRILRDLPAAAGFAMVVAGVAGAPLRSRALVTAPVRALGTLSYAIYLWHYVAIMYLRARGEWPEDMGSALALTLALTLPVSAVSWFALERPAMRWARRTERRRPVATLRPVAAESG
jgi:peptidoglycan/LPS O-acetylase OafA/YrhL